MAKFFLFPIEYTNLPVQHDWLHSNQTFKQFDHKSSDMENRYYYIVLANLLLFFISMFSVQAQWERQTPLPFPPFSGEAIDFSSSSHGFIAGDAADGSTSMEGRMLETTDGGVTWQEVVLNTTDDDMNDVFFFDANYGWAVGNIGYKTTDGGTTWTQMSNLPGGSHYHVNFIDQNFGWTVSNGGLCISDDGGNSWSYHGYNNGNLNAGDFLNASDGLAWGDYDLKKTDDGGNTWTTVFSTTASPAAKIIDIDKAVVVAETEFYYSDDGWNSWTNTYSGSWPSWAYMTIIKLSNSNLIAYNTQGDALYSTDSGQTWNTSTPAGGSYSHLKIDANTALLFGIGGSVYKTTDGGQTWTTTLNGSGLPVWGSTIRTGNEIWVVGNDGVIMKSLDNGGSWEYFSSGITGNFKDIKFFTDNVGLAGGLTGKTMRTSDGGLNWDPKVVGADIRSIHILDTMNAFVCGGNTVSKTSDQGLTWTHMTNPAGSNVDHSDICFVSTSEGWLVSEYWYGAIWHTTDGGNSWTQVYYDQGHPFKAIHMFNSNDGYAVGPGDGIFKTTDGFQTHQWLSFANNAPGTIKDIDFVSMDTLWIVGEDGFIAKSFDGGQTWTEQSFPGGGYNNDVTEIIVVSNIEAYAVTDMGDFLETIDGGTTWTVSTISGPVYDSWYGLAITSSGTWVSGTEVWYNSGIQAPLLPVELISFEVDCYEGINLLRWQTSQEINFDHFEIELSLDGSNWKRVGIVEGSALSGGYAYSFEHKVRHTAKRPLYRLKMVDLDGYTEFSSVVVGRCLPEEEMRSIYPNPVSQGKTIHIANKNENITWKLYDGLGTMIKSGNQSWVDTHELRSGVYYLYRKDGEKEDFQKISVFE